MNLREKILRCSFLAGACHIGSALSCVEIVEAVHEFKRPQDIFIFAKASGVAALYCYLHSLEKSWKFLKKYPLPSKQAGLIWSGGSLGMGLSVAAGMAYFNRKRKVYCLISDGELQEGQTWEAIQFAGHHDLSNLVCIVDNNKMQSLGEVKKVSDIEKIHERFREFRWQFVRLDGHDKKQIKYGLKYHSVKMKNCPKVIVADTIKGKGVSMMENDFRWHYRNLNLDGLQKALLEVGS